MENDNNNNNNDNNDSNNTKNYDNHKLVTSALFILSLYVINLFISIINKQAALAKNYYFFVQFEIMTTTKSNSDISKV